MARLKELAASARGESSKRECASDADGRAETKRSRRQRSDLFPGTRIDEPSTRPTDRYRGGCHRRDRGTLVCFKECASIDEAIDAIIIAAPSQIAHFWSRVSKLLTWNGGCGGSSEIGPSGGEKLRHLYQVTVRLRAWHPRELSTLAYAMGKMISHLQTRNGARNESMMNVLMENKDTPKRDVFQCIANASVPLLQQDDYNTRCISNVAYAFALVGIDPDTVGQQTFMEDLGQECLRKLRSFNVQDLSNMLWALVRTNKATDAMLIVMAEKCANLLERCTPCPVELGMLSMSFGKSGLAQHAPRGPARAAEVYVSIARAARPMLHKFKAQELSHLVYGCSLASCVPRFGDGSDLFTEVAREVLPRLRSARSSVMRQGPMSFLPLEICTLTLAFAKAGLEQTEEILFQAICDFILPVLPDLETQGLSNLAYSLALVDYIPIAHDGHALIEHIAYEAIHCETEAMPRIRSFNAQELSNLVWAYVSISSPRCTSGIFQRANAPRVSQILFAQGELLTALMNRASQAATPGMLSTFNEQNMANFLWSFAAAGIFDARLFKSAAPYVRSKMKNIKGISLATIAWAYSISNVSVSLLFGPAFVHRICQVIDNLLPPDLSMLHQYNLWQVELNQSREFQLPRDIQQRCHEAFLARDPRPSGLQKRVTRALRTLQLESCKEEVLLDSGYRVDCLVKFQGCSIAVEVDGPTHFIGRKQTGKTMLKHRQIKSIDGIEVVNVPWFEWDEEDGKAKTLGKEIYLRTLLEEATKYP